MVLLAMGLLSLVVSLSFHLKSRAVQRLPKDLPANIFDRTFSVFSPYPDKRRMIKSPFAVFFLIVFVVYAAWCLSFFTLAAIVSTGFLPSAIAFGFCATLMALEESFETHKNANVFMRVVREGRDLGQGDLRVLSVVKETLPKLSVYYLFLAIIFFAASATLPYLLPEALLAFAGLFGAFVEWTAFGGILATFYALLLLIVGVFVTYVALTKVKTKIFSFPPPESLDSLNKPFESMKDWIRWNHHELMHRPPRRYQTRDPTVNEKNLRPS